MSFFQPICTGEKNYSDFKRQQKRDTKTKEQ